MEIGKALKMEDVNSPIATEVCTASDLHRKQWMDELYKNTYKIHRLIEKVMGIDPANITNQVIIFLFIKNLYNKDTWWVVGAKTINVLVDTFKLPHHSLLKLKTYKGLVYSDEHEIAEINQIIDISKDIDRSTNAKQPDQVH